MMNIHKNDPNYELSFTSKNAPILTVENVKIRKDNKNTKSHIFEFLKKPIQSGVKPVYNRVYRGNSH